MERDGDFVLLETGKKVRITYSEKENSAVKCAVSKLAEDIRKVCDCNVELGSSFGNSVSENETEIIIITMDTPCSLQNIPEEMLPALERIMDGQGKGRWEAYLHQIYGSSFYIVGADRRGTVFGIYDLSEQLGISPWYFWADVPVRKKERFIFSKDYSKADWPDVPYRGIFLNDEEELEAWSKLHTEDDTIGPVTYAHIFELLLRLKANYIWPAMHVNYFNGDPENGKLAEKMGIIVGTSHCDMLLRSNQNEWTPWLKKKGYENIRYDYSLPDKNREIIKEYWAESVEMNQDYEVCYTVGMRGIHDSGFVTETIDQDASLTPQERTEKKIKLLEKVICDQRQILTEVLGEDKGKKAVQTFIPYKEVLDLYDGGLQIPEDVTLIWVDDNFGYMRRYPQKEERKRRGGNGLYYHSSYWASPGMSYLFFNSIPLAQTGNELKKCWEQGIRKMWVLNVGALKPLEIDTEFFLRYGWEAGRKEGETKDVSQFISCWINRNFSGDFGVAAADIYNRFAQLNNVCKPEHLQSDKFSQAAYGNEAKRRLDSLKELSDRAGEIYQCLPAEERDAFFELFLMKLQASYYINASFYYADRSRLFWEWGGMQAADEYLEKSRQMDRRKQELLYYYNHVMQNGKWEGILTPESFTPPPTVLYPAAKPALVIGAASLGAMWEDKFIFHPHGSKEKTIILYNKGCGTVGFRAEIPDWLEISEKEGRAAVEKMLSVHIRESERAASFAKGRTGKIVITGEDGGRFEIEVQALKGAAYSYTEPFYAEADGCISIPAEGYAESVCSKEACWRKIKHLGRGWGSAMEAFLEAGEDMAAVSGENLKIMDSCYLDYSFFLESSGAFLLEIHRFLTLNPVGKVRFAIGVDNGRPVIIETKTVDEWKGSWKEAVMNDGEKLYTMLPWLPAGLHRLKIYPVDQYVTLHKLVIYTRRRKESNFGPLESAFFDGTKWKEAEDDRMPESAREVQAAFWRELYGSPADKELLLPMLYAAPDFWKTERLYARSDEKENRLGNIKYRTRADGTKDVFQEFGNGLFEEQDGVVAIEAEYALENSENAYLTPSVPNGKYCWSHTQSETDGRSGLAMMIEGRGRYWENPQEAPGMHYRIRIRDAGNYFVWLLMKFEDTDSDSCYFALDGMVLDAERTFSSHGGFFTYSMKQRWHWRAAAVMEMDAGVHVLSVIGRKSGLRIDRIYLTREKDWPPVDADWRESKRNKDNLE